MQQFARNISPRKFPEDMPTMTDSASQNTQPTLTGIQVELRPLQAEHSAALLEAAADGQLWNMTLTVVPGPDTVQKYIATALAGRLAGSVMPFVIINRTS